MTQEQDRTMWLSWIAFLAGLWLIVSPFLMSYSGITAAMRNDVIVGAIVAVLAFVTAVWGRATAGWLSWIIGLVGIWEIAAHFVLSYTGTTSAVWNGVILGIIILVLGGARALTSQTPEMRREFGRTFPSEERPKKEE